MDVPVCLFLLRSVSFSFLILTVRITLGHTLKKSTPVVLLVCMKSYQRSFCLCCSFRKADAKVVLPRLPTKQKHNFFPEFFVNKYNSLTTKEVHLIGTPLYIYAHALLLCLGSNEFVTLAVDIDDLDGVIILEMLTEFGDVNIHTAGVEVVVINPY